LKNRCFFLDCIENDQVWAGMTTFSPFLAPFEGKRTLSVQQILEVSTVL